MKEGTESAGEALALRRQVFYRFQLLSSAGVFLSIAIGILAVHVMIADAQARLSLSLVLILIAIFIASSQLVSLYTATSRILTPLQQLLQVLR